MATIQELLARAAALREETALNSISPERAGGIMYDTVMAINELWLQQGSALVISKIYASVAAMEADDAPVSDITDQPLRAGQIVVIASSDSDNGSVYRYNGTEEDVSSWSLVGAIGNVQPVDSLDSDSTTLPLAAHQGKVLDGKIGQLQQMLGDNILNIHDISLTQRNINLVWDGSKYIINPNTGYEMFVIELNPGVYTLDVSGTLTNIGMAEQYPQYLGTGFTSPLGFNAFPSNKYAFSLKETRYLLITFETGSTLTLSKKYKNQLNFPATTGFVSSGDTLIERAQSIYDYYTIIMKMPLGIKFKTNIPVQMGFSDTDALTAGQNVGAFPVSAGQVVAASKEYVLFTIDSSVNPVGTLGTVYVFPEENEDNFVLEKTLTLAENSLPYTWNGTNFVYSPSYSSYIIRCLPGLFVRVPRTVLHAECFEQKPTEADITQLPYERAEFCVPVNDKYAYIKTTEKAKFIAICVENSTTSINVVFQEYFFGGKLSKKNIVCYGDSITEFTGPDGYNYPRYLGFISNANIFNVGIGGTRLAPREQNVTTIQDASDAYAALDILNMVKAAANNDFTLQEAAAQYLVTHASDDNTEQVATAKNIDYDDVDYFVVFGGANDFTSDIQIGTYQSTDETTTCGALNKIINLLCSNFPQAVVIVLTPEHRTFVYQGDDQYPDTFVNGNGNTLYELADAIEETANRQHCPAFNLMRRGIFNNYNHQHYFRYGQNLENIDNAHPYSGFYMLAKIIGGFIQSVLLR